MRDFGRQRRTLRRGGTPRLRRCLVVRYHRGRSRPQRCFAGPDGGEPGRGACRSSGQHACGMHGSAGGCKGVGSDPRLRILSRGRACAGLARGARPAATGRASRIYCDAPKGHLSSRLTSSMDRRVKERLVGASILVVLIVLVVPELLSGPPGPAPAPVGPRLPVNTPAEPVRNVTLDLATSKAPEPDPGAAQTAASGAQSPEAR